MRIDSIKLFLNQANSSKSKKDLTSFTKKTQDVNIPFKGDTIKRTAAPNETLLKRFNTTYGSNGTKTYEVELETSYNEK
jgi:hypothetical protein